MLLIIKTFFNKFQLFILFLNVLLGIIPVVSIYFFSKIVSSITEKTNFSDFIVYGLGLMISIMIGPIITDMIKIYSLKFEAQITKLCLDNLDRYYLEKDYLLLQSSKFQNKLMIVKNTNQIISEVFESAFIGVRNLVTLLGSLGLLINFPKVIILLIVILGLISLAINRYLGNLHFRQQMELLEKSRINQKKIDEISQVKNHPSIFFYNIIDQLGDVYTRLRDLKMRTTYITDFLNLLLINKVDKTRGDFYSTRNFNKEVVYSQKFSVNRMSFSFPNTDQKILDITSDLSFLGKEISLIKGGNGAGKSTFLNCILGLYKLDNLEVNFNGEKITNSIALKNIMKSSAAITLQHNLQLFGSLKVNLHKFQNESINEEFKIIQFVSTLHYMYRDRILDLEVEDGVNLSGGQWQCIYLARLFKEDRQIYILDEPSNHLDENKVELLIHDLKKLKEMSKIVILISHDPRLEVISDKIFTLNDGRMNEIKFQKIPQNT